MLPLAGEPLLHRPLIGLLARALRQACARRLDPPPRGADALRRALALAVTALLPRDGAAARIAELRLFARLTPGECAEVLQAPRQLVANVWRAARPALFARARAELHPPPIPPIAGPR